MQEDQLNIASVYGLFKVHCISYQLGVHCSLFKPLLALLLASCGQYIIMSRFGVKKEWKNIQHVHAEC